MSDARPADPRALAQTVQAALLRGALDEAERLAGALEAIAPDDPNTALLAGVIAYRRDRLAAAVPLLERATRLAPGAAQAWHWLGNAHRRQGTHAAACGCYRRVLDLAPRHADAAYNLAWSAKTHGDDDVAGAAFVRLGRLEPTGPEPLQQTVDAAARLARAGCEPPPAPALPGSASALPLVSFVICSITPARLEALRANLTERMAGHAWQLVPITDARSLCEGYSRGLALARGDRLVFCHDDIEILDEDFAQRLHAALDGADVVGVHGATRLHGPTVTSAGLGHMHGWVTHLDPQGDFLPGIAGPAGPRVDGAVCLDGVFIAVHRNTVERIGFDADTFDGFHLYDLDFSYRAHLAGLRVRIQCDLRLVHASRGNFDTAFAQYADRFLAKFPALAATPLPAPAPFFQTRLATREELRRFHGWIGHWLRECPVAVSAGV